METSLTYCGEKAFFSSDERKWIKRIRELKEQYPEEVCIIAAPETNDGCIYCQIPSAWLRIAPKRKVEMSEERKQELREQLSRIREASSESQEIIGEND